MTASALFAGKFLSALGWALFRFLWQGALVAGPFAALGYERADPDDLLSLKIAWT